MREHYCNPTAKPVAMGRPTARLRPTALLTVIAVSLAACDSANRSAASPPTIGSAPVATVIVKVTDPAGAPVRGATVALHAGVNPADPISDDKGEVVFSDTLAGEREASAGRQGYLTTTQRFVAADGSVTTLNLVIERRR